MAKGLNTSKVINLSVVGLILYVITALVGGGIMLLGGALAVLLTAILGTLAGAIVMLGMLLILLPVYGFLAIWVVKKFAK